MRRFLSQMLLLAALCVPWVTQGQGAATLTIGSGTSTASYIPTYAFYNFAMSQQIYTADEMGGEPGTISTVAFYNNNSYSPTRYLTVYLVNTSKASFANTSDWVTVTAADQVFSGNVTVSSSSWFTITLDTPFSYEGDNLLLVVDDNTESYTNSYPSYYTFTTGSDYQALYYYADNVNPDPLSPSISGTLQSYKNQVKFTFTPAPQTCPKPGELAFSNITATSADLSFTAGGSEANWIATVSPAVGGNTILNLNTPAYSFTGLDPHTTYNVGVRAVCGAGDTSFARSGSFQTICGMINIPYSHGFEDAATGSASSATPFDNCWTRVNDATSTSYQGYPYVYGSSSRTGSKCLYFYQSNNTSYPTNQIAALPSLNTSVNAVNTLRLKFWAKKNSSSYDGTLKVGVMTNPTDAATFVQVGDPITLTTTYAEYVIPLSDYDGTGAYVAVKCDRVVASSYQTIYVDDVTLEEIPACMEPTDLLVSAFTNTTATLAWTNGGSENNWNIQYKVAGDNDWTDYVTNYPLTGYTWANSNPYTITGLQPNTEYYVRVRAYCSDAHQSPWTSEISFTTACNTISTTPYAEGFENIASVSNCWTLGSNYSSPSSYVTCNATAKINGSYGLYLKSYKYSTTSDYYAWAAMPQLDASVNVSSLSVRFNAKSYSTVNGDTYTSKVTVGVMTDPSDTNTFTPIQTINIPTTSTVKDCEVDLSSYLGTGKYIAFLSRPRTGTSTYTSYYNYFYIDDIELIETPACRRVTHVAVVDSTITATSAKITWEPLDTSVHTFVIDVNQSATVVTVDSVYEYVITGLDPNSDCSVKVMALCSQDPWMVSDSSDAIQFHTPQQAVVVDVDHPFEDDFEGNSDWRFYGTDSNSWTIGTAATETGHSIYVTDRNSGRWHYAGVTGAVYATKLFTLSAGVYNISFDRIVNGANYDANYYFRAYLIPAANSYTSITGSIDLDNGPVYGGPYWRTVSKEIAIPTAGDYTLVLRWYNMTDTNFNPPAAVDNIALSYNRCPTPTNVTASNVTAEGATITWTPAYSTQTLFMVTWGPDNDPEGDMVGLDFAETNSFTITDLESLTDYNVFVKAVCDEDGESQWVSRCSFRTLIDCGDDYRHAIDTFGTGTSSSYNSLACASSSYKKGYTATIFKKSELETMGLYDNNEIHRIFLNTTSSVDLEGFKVMMRNTSKSSLTTGDTAYCFASTPVYEGTFRLGVGWHDILLTNAFNYNPDSNLLVVLYRADTSSLLGNVYAYCTSVAGSTLYGYSAAYDGTMSRTTSTYRPNMIFEICSEIPQCTPAHDVVANNVTATSARIRFDVDDNDHDRFYVSYGLVNNPEDSNMTRGLMDDFIVDDYLTLTNLTPQTTYYVFVKADCGSNGQSSWSSEYSFTTPCAAVAVPWNEGFETMASGSSSSSAPACWNLLNANDGSYPYIYVNTSSGYVHAGSKSLYFQSSSSRYGYVVLPQFDTPLNELQISFWYKDESTSSSGRLFLGYMTDPSDASTFVPLDEFARTTTFTKGQMQLSDVPTEFASNARLAFRYGDLSLTYSNYFLGIDDILVEEIPSCIEPSQVAVNNVTPNSATIGWTPFDASMNNYQVAYGTRNILDSMTVMAVTGSSVTLTGLNSGTTYYYCVRTVCGQDSTGWSPIGNFTTSIALPFFEDFEASTSIPSTWSRYSGIWGSGNVTASGSNGWGVKNTLQGLAANHMYNNVYGTSKRDWIATPNIYLNANAQLSFDLALTAYSGNGAANTTGTDDKFIVLASTDNGSSWTELAAWDNASSSRVYNNIATDGEEVIIPLTAYVGQSVRIAFYVESTVSNADNNLHIDNVLVEAQSACPKPTEVTAINSTITGTGATIEWNANSNEYILAYGTTDDTNTMATVNVIGRTETLTGLTPNTAYYVRVRSVCSADEISNWSNAISFRTSCVALTAADLPYTEDFESYASGSNNPIDACWTKGTNSTTAYPYPYSSAAISGSIGLYFYGYYSSYSTPTYCYAALPELASDLNVTGLTLRFKAKRYGSTGSTYHSTIQVGVMTNPELVSTFVPVQTIDMTAMAASTAQTYEVDLASYTGAGKYVAFFAPEPDPGTSTYAYNYIYVDDVELMATPTCFRPTSVSVAATTATSATIEWTPDSRGSGNVFELAYGLDTLQFDNLATTNVANATSYTLSNLEPNTNYKVYMRSLCGTMVSSDWTDVPVTFRTLNDATEITAFAITSAGVQKGAAVIDAANHTVDVMAYMGYDLDSLNFSYTLSNGAAVYIGDDQVGSYADFSSPLTLTVKAEDRSFSQNWTVTVTFETCGTPRNLAFTNVTRTSMDISWTNPDTNVSSFAFYLGTTPYDPSISTSVQVNADTYHAADLLRNTVYYVHVAPMCGPVLGDAIEGQRLTMALDPNCELATEHQFGTSTTAIQYVPWSDWYNSTYSQQIYTASELTAAGVTPGYIGKVAFQYALGASYAKTATIYMGSTTQSEFATTSYLPVEQVSDAHQITFSTAGQWYEIAFSQPFYWDGTSNIVVGGMFMGTNYPPSGTATFYGTTGTTNMSCYSRSDNGTPSTSTGTRSMNRSNIKFFNCADGDPCPAVASVTATEVGVDDATLTWAASEGDYANTYDVWLSTEEVTDFETAPAAFAYSGTGTSCTLSNLNAYTQYYAYVRVRCNAQNSHQIDDGVSTWTGTAFHTNSACAVLANAVATVTGKHTATLTWENTSETQNDNFRVVLSTSELDDPGTVTAFYAQYIDSTSLNLTNLISDTTYYCYIQNSCGNAGNSPWISCSFTTPEAMPAVINLHAYDISFNAFRIAWERDVANYADETLWEYVCVPHDSVPGYYSRVAEPTVTLFGLTPETQYDVYVLPTDGTQFGNARKITVTTAAAQSGSCVTVADGSSTSEYVPVYGLYCDAPQHSQSIYPASMLTDLQGKTITSLKYYVYSGTSMGGYGSWEDAVFNVRMATTDQSNLASGFVTETMTTVYSGTLSANATDGMALTLDQPFTYTGGNLLIEFELPEEMGYSQCFFYGQSATSASRYAYEDWSGMTGDTLDFLPKVDFCTVPENCQSVTHLAASNITTTGASISWYPGNSEIEWQYVVSTEIMTDSALAEAAPTSIGTISADLFNLIPDQDYYCYVRPICDTIYYGSWRSVHFITLPSCSAPNGAIAIASANNEITLRVVDGEFGTPASYDYKVWANGSNDTLSYNAQTSPFVVNGLQGLTTYSWKARANCSAVEGSSRWTNGNDVYVCGDATITDSMPLIETFENAPSGNSTSTNFVSCWNRLNNGAQYFGHPFVYNYSTYAYQGTKLLYWCNSTTDSTYGDYQVVVLPGVTNEVNTLQLGFMAKASSASYHPVFQIGVMTDPTDVTTFDSLATVHVEGTTYALYNTSLAFYNGNGKYVAIKAVRPASTWYVYMDNISLSIAPSCVAPVDVAVSNVEMENATISWQATAPNQTSYLVAYGSANSPDSSAMSTIVANGTSITLTGLTSNTGYNVFVRTLCGDDSSAWTEGVSFRTKCPAIDVLPYTEGFEDYTGTTYNTNGVAPNCWKVYSTNSTLPHVIGSGSYYYVHTGTKTLHFYGYGTQYAALPEFETPLNQLMVDFWTRMENASYGTLTVGYITEDDVDFNTFHSVATINSSTYMTNRKVALNNLPDAAARLVFKWYYGSQWSCCIDDIKVDSIRYNVTVASNNVSYGTVAGNGTYTVGSTAEISATPNFGYTFVMWNDSVTDAVRQVTVNGDVTYTATFAVDPCVIRVADLPWTENFDSITTITTTKTMVEPNCWTLVYQDVNMSDEYKPMIYCAAANAHSGNYSLILNKRGYYAMPGVDVDLSALQLSFYVKQTAAKYRLVVGVMSDLDDLSTFQTISTINCTSTTESEYKVVDFSNYTGNGRYIVFHNVLASGSTGEYSCNYLDDLTLGYATRTINVVANDEAMGTVTGAGTFMYGTRDTLTATANEHYHFVSWNDQNTQNPRYITVTENATYTAIFAVDEYNVSLSSSNNAWGTVNGAGSYGYNDEATLTAVPSEHYRFVMWNDSVVDNPRTLNVTENVHLTATFAPMQYNVTVVSSDETLGTVTGGGVFNYNSGVVMVATTIAEHYHFAQWSDGTTNNPRMFQLVCDTTFIAYFEMDQYQITADVNVDTMGTVTGTGYYDWNTSATIEAVPAAEHSFVMWSDSVTANPRTINNIVEDQHFTAIFEYAPSVICGIHAAEFPYTENFDDYTTSTLAKTGVEPDCWTLASMDVTMTDEYKPMIYYSASNAHSGGYSLLLNKRGIYAMPAVDTNVSALQMSLYVKQSKAEYRLVVGVMSDLNDASTFVPVATINNSSTTNMVYHEVSFADYTGNGRYIAFRNTNSASSTNVWGCNYIDDITLDIVQTVEDECGIHVADLPITETFENYTSIRTAKTGVEPTCWTLASMDVTMTDEYKPMLYCDVSNAQSGKYSLLLNKRGIYAMPAIDTNVSALRMSLYVKQGKAEYQLQVGVMTDLDNASTFVPVATINNSGTSGLEYHEVSFASYAGEGRYIAFRNTNTTASSVWGCNYIDDITISLNADTPMDICGIHVADMPYTETFETYTVSKLSKTGIEPTCWTLAHMDVSMTNEYKPMIYYGSSNSRSGDYSLLLNKRGIYAMPAVDTNVSALQMGLYVKQGKAEYQLIVGVMSDLNNAASFVPVATIINSGTTGMEYHEVNFANYAGEGRYIAFRNTNTSASSVWGCNYIDDITISVRTEEEVDTCGIKVANLPYTWNFDNYTTSTIAKTGIEPECWTLAHMDVTMTDEYKPMVYYGASNAQSGNYSLLLNKRGIYAMPMADTNVSALQMSLYVKQGKAEYELIVGVMSDINNASSFVPVDTINNASTSMEYHEVSFANYTGTGRYIAFRNANNVTATSVWGCNYLDDITLSVAQTACNITLNDLPYMEDFDNYTTSTTAKTFVEPNCWTLVHQDVSMTDEYKPMVYYNAANAHSGNYSLLLNKRGIYAMPAVDMDVNTLQLGMYVKQGNVFYRMVVGVMSNLNDVSTFVPVDTIANATTTDIEYHEVNFSSYRGTGRYIAFRNINTSTSSGSYSCNYIDDIVLDLIPVATCSPISEFPYSENFDNYTTSTTAKTGVEPDCWELVHQYVTMADEYKPMVYYASANAHSDNYSLIINKRGIYAMPEVSVDVNTLQLSMYLKQTATKYQLVVGVMTDKHDVSTFVPVQTINNSTTGIEQVTVDFSSYTGNGHYIAFKNILAAGYSGDYSCNYLDDVTLNLISAPAASQAEMTEGEKSDEFSVSAERRELNVYPNPTTGKLTIDADEVVRVDVYDYTGRNVATFNNKKAIDITNMPAGIYTLRVTTAEGTEVRRVVKH